MVYILYWLGAIVVASCIGIGIESTESIGAGEVMAVRIILTGILVAWGGGLLCSIKTEVHKHIGAFNEIKQQDLRKASYMTEMKDYKEEMKTELLEKYRQFEQTLMESVKDSNLLAAMLKESGYDSVLKSYDSHIKSYLMNANSCDRKAQDLRTELLTRQADFFTWGCFVPKHFRIEE